MASIRKKLAVNANNSKNTRMDIASAGTLANWRPDELAHISRFCKMGQIIMGRAKQLGRPVDILEIGCGAGSLSYHLRDIKSDLTVVTLDGNQGTLKSPYIKDGNHFIVLTDSDYELVDENNNIILFDLVLCFEHFEHIHVDRFGKFLENIKKHSTKDTVIIATASTWPDGRDHCNIKNRYGWIQYLNSEGFEMIDNTIIEGNAPFNFVESLTSELVFKIKS